ncbi:MAG TPA: CHRD domain-containing protein [Pyrinomonadaceae bacterium]|nr:CHRD domain-containing protein [Pyrinomonadaceae bacterium]
MQQKIFSFLLAFAAAVLLGSAAQAQQQFTAALNTIQEVPPPANSLGRGSCLVTLNTAETQITVTCSYSNLSSGLTAGHIHNAPPGVNAGVLIPFTGIPTGSTSGTFTTGPFNLTPAQVAEMRAKRLYVNLHTTNFPNGEIRGQVKIQTTPSDFDGDGRTDLKVYRPSAATTFTMLSVNNSIFSSAFGSDAESPILSAGDDYDGDGRGDIVLTSPINGAFNWRILQTGSNTIRAIRWGVQATDSLVPADYDGDGKTDIAVYRRSTGVWYIIQSTNNTMRAEIWGQIGDIPNVGDFDKDGKNDLTVFRDTADGRAWFTRRSSDNSLLIAYWGGATAPAVDFVVPAAQIDIDGDGIQDRMVIRDPIGPAGTPNLGNQVTYFILRSSDNTQFGLPFGLDTDERRFGDYDGDGKTDIAALRNIGGQLVWFIYQSSNAQVRVVNWGILGDA